MASFRSRFLSAAAAAVLAAGAATSAQALQVSVRISLGNFTEGLINLSCMLISSAGVCVRVVTHAIVNGNEVVRQRDIVPVIGSLLVNQGQPIDVTGDGQADLSVTLAVPLKLLPPGPDTEKPTLRVSKLSGAPAVLPVKIEVVTDDVVAGRKISFGYDARSSTAPSSFLAAVDQSNRDGLPQTSQTKVDLSIAPGASKSVALVQESFIAGSTLAEAQRTDRSIVSLGFSAVVANNTQVPTTALIDATSSPGTQRFVVTSNLVTTADIRLISPNDNPKITGTINRLPTAVDLKITDTDTNNDGESDQSGFDYSGNAVVPQGQFQFSSLAEDALGTHRRTITISAKDLPTKVKLDYAPGPGTVEYAASSRAAQVKVEGSGQRPFFKRALGFTLTLDDLPKHLDAGYGGGNITAKAYDVTAQNQEVPDKLGQLLFSGREGIRILPPCLPDAICDDFDDPNASGFLQEDLPDYYLLFARIFNLKSASIVTQLPPPPIPDDPVICPDPEGCSSAEPSYLDALIDTAADAGGSYRPFVARIKKLRDADEPALGETSVIARLSALLPMTHYVQLTGAEDGGLFSYDNAHNGAGPDVTVDGFNLDGLPKGSNFEGVRSNAPDPKHLVEARELHVKLDGLPSSMEFTYGQGGFPLKFSSSGADNKLDLLSVRMNSTGDLDALPATEDGRPLDGVFLRDFNDRFVVDARVHNLKQATINRQAILTGQPCFGEPDKLEVTVTTDNGGLNPKLRFDSKKSDPFFTYPPISPQFDFVRIAEVFATVDQIPGTISVKKFPGAQCESRLEYSASAPVPSGLALLDKKITQVWSNGFPVNGSDDGPYQDIGIVPLPMVFQACKSSDKQICYTGTGDEASAGSLQLTASEPTKLTVTDLPNVAFLDTYTQVDLDFRKFQLVAHAPDGGSSYIGIHTGWDSSQAATPPPESQVTGFMKKQRFIFPDVEVDHFVFGEGFAADNRVISWDSTLGLVAALYLGTSYDVGASGTVNCLPGGMHIYERREAFADEFVTVDLQPLFCPLIVNP